jgi:hypothetical protein
MLTTHRFNSETLLDPIRCGGFKFEKIEKG